MYDDPSRLSVSVSPALPIVSSAMRTAPQDSPHPEENARGLDTQAVH